MWPHWMGIVNKNNQGFLINVGFNHAEERVEWWARYSERLYDVLVEYGIIQPPKKGIFVHDPNVIHFEAPPRNHLQKKPRVITTFRERDSDQFYIKIDPSETPVYVQVDPNSPGVYIAVDSNWAQLCLKELLPGINVMKERSEELMAQNRWLTQTLDRCLKKLEAEKGLQPIINEPNDYMNRFKPSQPGPIPYTKLQTKPLPETSNISRLRALVNLHCFSLVSFIYSARESIKSFEKRMQRVEVSL